MSGAERAIADARAALVELVEALDAPAPGGDATRIVLAHERAARALVALGDPAALLARERGAARARAAAALSELRRLHALAAASAARESEAARVLLARARACRAKLAELGSAAPSGASVDLAG